MCSVFTMIPRRCKLIAVVIIFGFPHVYVYDLSHLSLSLPPPPPPPPPTAALSELHTRDGKQILIKTDLQERSLVGGGKTFEDTHSSPQRVGGDGEEAEGEYG